MGFKVGEYLQHPGGVYLLSYKLSLHPSIVRGCIQDMISYACYNNLPRALELVLVFGREYTKTNVFLALLSSDHVSVECQALLYKETLP